MSLEECYGRVGGLTGDLDGLDVVEEVERYRNFWRPDSVRVILLAESHVRTSHDDFVHSWSQPTDPAYRGNFVRFVYCLAYGEQTLVDIRPNSGTPQYWKILFSCLHQVSEKRDFGPILRSYTENAKERIDNKIRLLRDLQAAGIWLVDASFVGINGLANDTKSRILRISWQCRVGPLLKWLDPKPEHIIVIGTAVKNTLYDGLRTLGVERTEIPQPQAHIRGGYWRHYHQCFDACSKALKK